MLHKFLLLLRLFPQTPSGHQTWQWNISHLEMMFPLITIFIGDFPATFTSCLAVFIQADAIAFGAMLDVEMGSWQISLWLLKQMEEHHMRRS
jgi:hypothetical protein